ncbi:D-alanine--D-alanine ligase [Luteimonas fraxinea]|uniref:D-alanine--D-alanine ligase n=1 Tax=Luteimonas fraxinea TaxID=2901869 RepID=A0ABS8U951_9GAMM|nr:D-alanine--D-alanine ligase [Luteimonas fraxinea]MCD9095784.1 D-alanine--D-alanine ligase [Luteimonas fraxinea]MCD9124363.1 D-alanine--D-alanine ligase [Luteimonas fraxinea]UHH11032.1 D-alanine--D-alanine ligase [Luteimonas fraxinea]
MSLTLSPPRFTDPAVFGRVAVLLGGPGSEREVSLQSGQGVLDALRSRGVDAHAVDGVPALAKDIVAGRFDRVFNILHGGDGENGVVQGLCDAFAIPYTGSRVLGSALTMDKIRTKQVWMSLDLPTPRYRRLQPGDDVHAAAREIGLPVIIKPSKEGSSVGISRVFEDADLDAAVELAARYPGELLMEQMVEGDELTVAVIEDVEGPRALPSIRIVPKGAWYDYEAKYVSDDTQYLCPGLDGDDEMRIGALAVDAFVSAGCSGWGRVDVMRDRRTGALLLLEVNTAPGMTSHSLVPKAAAKIGIDYPALCWRVLEATIPSEVAPR